MLEKLESCGVVAAIRADSSERLIDVAKALEAGGAKFIEVTMSTPNALKVIETLADTMGDRVGIGVGTVLDPETARAAILAGAEYIVAPSLRISVIELFEARIPRRFHSHRDSYRMGSGSRHGKSFSGRQAWAELHERHSRASSADQADADRWCID